MGPKDYDVSEYFQIVRESSSTTLWSQAVALSRRPVFGFIKTAPDELVVQVDADEELVSPKVQLWIPEEDWQCSCSSKNDPCKHVISSLIVLKRLQQEEKPFPVEGSSASKISYLLSNDSGALYMRRAVGEGENRKLFMNPLSAFATGCLREFGKVTVTQTDMKVESYLGAIKSGVFQGAKLGGILTALVGNESVYFEDAKIEVKASNKKPVLYLKLSEQMYHFQIEGRSSYFHNGCYLLDNHLYTLDLNDLKPAMLDALRGKRKFSKNELTYLLSEVIPVLKRYFEVDTTGIRLPEIVRVRPEASLLFSAIDSADEGREPQVKFQVRIDYGHPVLASVVDGKFQVVSVEQLPQRQLKAEKKILEEVFSLGPRFDHKQSGLLTFDEAISLRNCMVANGVRASESGVNLTAVFQGEFELELGSSGLRVFIANKSSGDRVSLNHSELSGLMAKRINHFNLGPIGSLKIPREFLDQYGDEVLGYLRMKGAEPKYYAHAVARLAEESGINCEIEQKQKVLLGVLADQEGFDFDQIKEGLPKINAELRPYQKTAALWMTNLRNLRAGAMLADDMGLGKTLQTICILVPGSLVVVPTSLLKNWHLEIS